MLSASEERRIVSNVFDNPVPQEAFEKGAECYKEDEHIKVYTVKKVRPNGYNLIHREYTYSVQSRDPYTHQPLLMWFDLENNLTLSAARRLKRFHSPGLKGKNIRIVRVLNQIEAVR